MSLILGLNAYHPDAAACLLYNGKLIAAVAEERLGNRVKHTGGFPSQAINCVMKIAGASAKDIDYVAVGHDNNSNIIKKLQFVLTNPISSGRAVVIHAGRRRRMRSLTEEIATACNASHTDCRFRVIPVEHHLAHVASAFFASPFDQAGAFSYDGSGDFVSGMFARCEGNRIHILRRVFVPHSLGFFYTAICQFIGFDQFGEEYKVMGLAAYGRPAYRELMREMLRPEPNGRYKLNPMFFRSVRKGLDQCIDERGEVVLPALYSEELVRRVGPPRTRGETLDQRERDLAASCQEQFEDVVIYSLNTLHREVPVNDLVTAGGCALNGVCNARILRATPFRRAYVQCAASDDGTALGAALYVWNSVLEKPRGPIIDHAYWGSEHSEFEMKDALESVNLPFRRYSRPMLLDLISGHLLKGHIVGWYQGRSEWGPRALGNRSILAHPGWPKMKELINKKIKRRESFRPFAPTILWEEVGSYFEQVVESPFMMHVVKIKADKRQALAAVCHEDFTGRLHTLKREQNPLYYDLIRTFYSKGGLPVMLNTSFNENEPIVETPAQAVACYHRTDIDVLALGPFVVVKPGKEINC